MAGISKAYDIRGSYPDEPNEEAAFKIGAAFVKLPNAGNQAPEKISFYWRN